MRGSRIAGGVRLSLVVAAVLAAGGCSSDTERHLEVHLGNGQPIGVGLTARLHFGLVECDGPAPGDGTCANADYEVGAETFKVEAASATVSVGDVFLDTCNPTPPGGDCEVAAEVTGLAQGKAHFTVTINDVGPVDVAIDVQPVGSSFVEPFDVVSAIRNPSFFQQHYTMGTISTFARSVLILGQEHYSVEAIDGLPPPEVYRVQGASRWIVRGELGSLDPRGDELGPATIIDVAEGIGTFEVATENGANLALQVVDRSGVSAAAIVDPLDFTSPGDSLTLEQGKRYAFEVVPFGAFDQLIFGAGETPTHAIDGDVIEIEDPDNPISWPHYTVVANAAGSATLEFDFDDVATSIPVFVE